MALLTAVIHRDITHKQCCNFSDSSTALCVVCTAVIGGGENRTGVEWALEKKGTSSKIILN